MNIAQLREKGLEYTAKQLQQAIGVDQSIIQLITFLDEQSFYVHRLEQRLRTWYGLYDPEGVRNAKDSKALVTLVEAGKSGSLGKTPEKEELQGVQALAQLVGEIVQVEEKETQHLETLMQLVMPNVTAVCGALIGARLLAHAGSLKSLMDFPASTIQTLGAEKAMFRHLKSGSKPPKYGLLLGHPYVADAKDKGKAARRMADTIAIAVKVDYFKGDYMGEELQKRL